MCSKTLIGLPMNSRSNRLEDNKMKFLQNNYELDEFDVICGRGNESYSHKGNQRFRELVMSQLQRFKGCRSKWEKTRVISEVIDHVRFFSGSGGFIRLDIESWRYYQISDVLAREKVSQAFRAAIYEESKSSRSQNRKDPSQSQHCKTIFEGHTLNKIGMEVPIIHLSNCMGNDWMRMPCHQIANDTLLLSLRGSYGKRNQSDRKVIADGPVTPSVEEVELHSSSFSGFDNGPLLATQIPADDFQQIVSRFANPSGSHQEIDHSVVSHDGFQNPVALDCNNDDDEGLFNALMELSKGVVEAHRDDLLDPFEPLPI